MGMKHRTSTAEAAPGLIGAAEWDEDHDVEVSLQFPEQATDPAPASNIVQLFAKKMAQRGFMATENDSDGTSKLVQPSFFESNVGVLAPGTSFFGITATTQTTGTGAAVAAAAPANTNNVTACKRFTFTTGTTATGAAGYNGSNTDYWRGDAAGRGGFFGAIRFGIQTWDGSGLNMFFGILQTTTILGDVGALSNMIGIGRTDADTTWQFLHNAASTVTKFNTGVTCTVGQVLDFFFYAPPNGTEVHFMLRDAFTGAILAEYTATTNLPAAATTMRLRAQAVNRLSSVVSKVVCLMRYYMETDN